MKILWQNFPLDIIYSISSVGDVYNNFSGKLLKLSKDKDGYLYVELAGRRKIKIHRAVLMTFVRMPLPGEEGSHLNGIRTDNRLENLIWESRQENSDRRYEHNTICNGERGGLAKLTNEQVIEIRKLREEGRTLTSLAEEFGVSHRLISAIYHRKIWKHI